MVSLSTDSWAQSGSDTEITGEISARIDGERVVWQSFDAHGRAGALWRRQDVDTGRVAMAAFEATPVPFSDPDWHGSQITLSLEFPLDGSSVTHRLAQGADGPASLHIVPAAGDYERMLMIGDGIVAATDVVL